MSNKYNDLLIVLFLVLTMHELFGTVCKANSKESIKFIFLAECYFLWTNLPIL